MAGAAAAADIIGSITFSSGFFANIINANMSGISRAMVDTSHQGLADASAGTFGNMTFVPSRFIDPGQLEVELNFNPETLPPIGAAAETVTVTFDPSGSLTVGANWAGSGAMSDFAFSGPFGDRGTATATIKFSGAVTVTAGS